LPRARADSSSTARRRATSAASSVAGAGDVNGDGLADVIVGAYQGDTAVGGSNAGRTTVVFGKTDTGAVDLGPITGARADSSSTGSLFTTTAAGVSPALET